MFLYEHPPHPQPMRCDYLHVRGDRWVDYLTKNSYKALEVEGEKIPKRECQDTGSKWEISIMVTLNKNDLNIENHLILHCYKS